ncbi:MAG: hypothetical protein JSW12_09195, partial [Deltaproteobacteria bacterium]
SIGYLTRRCRYQLHYRQLAHRFSAATLSYQAYYFTLVDVVGNTVHGLNQAAVRFEAGRKVFYIQ